MFRFGGSLASHRDLLKLSYSLHEDAWKHILKLNLLLKAPEYLVSNLETTFFGMGGQGKPSRVAAKIC